jgi:hypothetical protein
LFAALIDGDFLDACRIAVEIRVGEVPGGGAGEVDDVEVFLAVVDLQPRASPDDLLELRTREPTTRASTTFLTISASTPVVSNCDVVRMTGVGLSTS